MIKDVWILQPCWLLLVSIHKGQRPKKILENWRTNSHSLYHMATQSDKISQQYMNWIEWTLPCSYTKESKLEHPGPRLSNKTRWVAFWFNKVIIQVPTMILIHSHITSFSFPKIEKKMRHRQKSPSIGQQKQMSKCQH